MRRPCFVVSVAVALTATACGARTGLLLPVPEDAAGDDASPDAMALVDSGVLVDATADVGLPDAGRDVSPVDATPVDARPGCDASCTVGDTRCDGDSVSTCENDATGCGVWGAPAACPQGSTCALGSGASCRALDVEVPRAISPLSTSRVTSHRPTLRWALTGQDDGALVEICTDHACNAPVTSFAAVGTSATPPQPLAPGVYFWRLRGAEGMHTSAPTSPAWELTVPVRDAPVDTSWGTSLDIDADGYADVVVGAHIVQNQAGAFVYTGGPSGLAPPVSLLDPPGWYSSFVASGGDLDGDGYPELIVGGSQLSAFLVYRGGPAWASTKPTTVPAPAGSSEFGAWIASAGDVNHDGYGDLLVDDSDRATVYLYFGSPTGLSGPPQLIPSGILIASMFASDVNGDGNSDVIIANDTGPNTSSATVSVYLGTATGLSSAPVVMTFPGPTQMNWFILNLSDAGDVDGDGYGDFMVSAEPNMPRTVQLFLGSPNGPMAGPVLPDPGTGPYFGIRLAGPGDVDGDGYDDVVVGIVNQSPRQACIYRGGPAGPGPAPSITLTAPAGSTGGYSDPLAALGDVNRDGHADVGVGDINGTGNYVYLGAPSGVQPVPLVAAPPPGVQEFGESMASIPSIACVAPDAPTCALPD